jgi:flagellar M-ring protein FliF
MQNILNKIRDFFSNLWNKTSTLAKIIIGAAILLVIVLIIVLIATSSRPDMVPLVRGSLSEGDYTRVTQELEARDIKYRANPRTRNVYVSSPEQATQLRTELALDEQLQDKDGYELFDTQSFTTTEFERNVQLQRTMERKVELHLESIDDVERAEVDISFPQVESTSLWETIDYTEPLTASVTITPAPGSEITDDSKRIRGIQTLVSKAVDNLEPDNVHVFDHRLNELTVFEGSEDSTFDKLSNFNKLREMLKRNVRRDIEQLLKEAFSPEGYSLAINTDIDRDESEIMAHKLQPVQIREDNPNTPQDESKVEIAVPISESKTDETYRGQVFIPEGSPSPDFTIPPGAKQVSDQYNTYTNQSTIINNEIGTVDETIDSPPGDQLYINVAVTIDYEWEWERDPETNQIVEDPITRTRGRIYTPPSQEVLDNIRNNIETYINIPDKANPGKVSVKALLFRSTLEKHKQEDEEYFRAKDTQRVLLYSAIGLGIVILLILLFFWIRGIIRERRRRREEELARQRQAMREAALRAAEQEGVILDMSPEDKARLEMQENAIRLARERPEDVAKLLRTWMSED